MEATAIRNFHDALNNTTERVSLNLNKNENYTQYCLDAGLTPKAKMARFPITENARLQPGTPLHVQHFHVGQYIDIVIRSVNFGHVDVVTVSFNRLYLALKYSVSVKLGLGQLEEDETFQNFFRNFPEKKFPSRFFHRREWLKVYYRGCYNFHLSFNPLRSYIQFHSDYIFSNLKSIPSGIQWNTVVSKWNTVVLR